jgi:hypothetical protein
MITTQQILCKVLLEGIEVPFNSIQINESASSPPSATITFPAESSVITILPKTVAHVFYQDITADEDRMKLIFQGELAGTGISFTADKRVISLTFLGITQNWNTNVVIPMDIKIRNTVQKGIYVQFKMNDTNDAPKADKFTFSNLALSSPLDPILKELVSGNSLSTVLKKLITFFSTDNPGVYWKALSNAFQFNNMTVVDKFAYNIQDLVLTVATKQHVFNQTNGIGGEQPIAALLNTILRSFGFDYCEIAAPTKLGANKRASIFIKPKTHFFAPLKQNVMIDDNITMMNFSRNFDLEPTRLIGKTVPAWMQQQSDIVSMILSVVVPNNVALTKAISAGTITTPAEYEKLKMFGLSEEEQCRGVVIAEHEDTTGIEQSYLLGLAKDNVKYKDVDGTKTLWNKLSPIASGVNAAAIKDAANNRRDLGAVAAKGSGLTTPGTHTRKAEMYHLNLATAAYYDIRHGSRTVQLDTPYTPYRMVGFPGVIISNYLPKGVLGIVGILASTSSTISANGNATQAAVFTHCRMVTDADDKHPDATLGFLDDDLGNPIPWYANYMTPAASNTFYEQFTGISNSAVVDTTVPNIKSSIRAGIRNIRDSLDKATNGGSTKNDFMFELTKRELVTQTEIEGIYPVGTTRTLKSTAQLTMESKLYVKERQDRIKEIFGVTT